MFDVLGIRPFGGLMYLAGEALTRDEAEVIMRQVRNTSTQGVPHGAVLVDRSLAPEAQERFMREVTND